MFPPAAPRGGFIFVKPGCRFVSAQIACTLSSGGRLQKRGMAQLPWGEELHFQSLEGSHFFLFSLTLFFVHAAGICVSDRPFRPNQIVKRGDRVSGVYRRVPALSRQRKKKARQVPRIVSCRRDRKR